METSPLLVKGFKFELYWAIEQTRITSPLGRTLGTKLGGMRMNNARFEHFGESFEVVCHNINL